jgi:hypothetical protein
MIRIRELSLIFTSRKFNIFTRSLIGKLISLALNLDEGKLFFAKGEGAHIEPFYYLSILGSIN